MGRGGRAAEEAMAAKRGFPALLSVGMRQGGAGNAGLSRWPAPATAEATGRRREARRGRHPAEHRGAMRGGLQKKGTMSQIDILNSSLTPTDEEMESAKKSAPRST